MPPAWDTPRERRVACETIRTSSEVRQRPQSCSWTRRKRDAFLPHMRQLHAHHTQPVTALKMRSPCALANHHPWSPSNPIRSGPNRAKPLHLWLVLRLAYLVCRFIPNITGHPCPDGAPRSATLPLSPPSQFAPLPHPTSSLEPRLNCPFLSFPLSSGQAATPL